MAQEFNTTDYLTSTSMRYQNYTLQTPEPCTLQEVIKHCPYGILHVRDQETGNKLAILVEVSYSSATGICCRVAHSQKEVMDELLQDAVSLKLCNREKNIYMVADVTVSRERKAGLLSRVNLKVVVNRFNFFRKNKYQQMIAATNN
jgi:hypothetical protein